MNTPKSRATARVSLAVLAAVLMVLMILTPPARAAVIWIEGEKPSNAAMNRHPWWYDQVKKDQLSGGDFISNWNGEKAGLAEYRFDAPRAGEFEFWVRANPLDTRLSYKLNDGGWVLIDLAREQEGNTNIAADGKPDLRFIAWSRAGKATLKKGSNTIRFKMDSKNNNHGSLDCFVFSDVPFHPVGTLKPGEVAKGAAEGDKGWFGFAPPPDGYKTTSGIDLRGLNERVAGEGGFIGVKGSQFVHTETGRPVRFWAVNGVPGKDREALRRDARALAKRGVNLVRIHGGYFDENGEVDLAKVKHAIEIVEELKAEGIYCHFSTYFPLWLTPKPDNPWLKGYDGQKYKLPFVALYFNKDFQKHYLSWWKALLTTPSEKTGKRLIDEPAVAGAELINEDSYLFWTFDVGNIPDPQLRILETLFGDWLKAKYGSIDGAFQKWGGLKVARDAPGEGRVSFRPLWNVANERTPRDKDTVRFLTESQRGFYRDSEKALRDLGFKGVVTASNWFTADPRVLEPLEKYSYTACDFIDRHNYFGCNGLGENSGWSVQNGHTYVDRSALRFDPDEPGKPKIFMNAAMDPSYDGKPSMISETTFNRPNRYRSEAPLFYAAFGALQDSDAIVHFAMDTTTWSVKPGYFMQPWTIMTPAMMGQFPAAALIYRKGLVDVGDLLVNLNLGVENLYNLQGTPLPQDALFLEENAKDSPQGTTLKPGNLIDPLVHFAGRTNVDFSAKGGPAKLKDLSKFIDRKHQTVTSSTSQLRLDYGKGVLTIDAPAAQGVSGALREAGTVDLKDLVVTSGLELGHIIAVSLDDRPLASSKRILLQAMSEEKASGFRTEPASGNVVKKIVHIGQDPWMVKEIEGTVKFKRPDAGTLKVTVLDGNGDPMPGTAGPANAIKLRPETLYYLITP